MYKVILISVIFLGLALLGRAIIHNDPQVKKVFRENPSSPEAKSQSPTPKVKLISTPPRKVLDGGTHVFQTFNNCGPASLSMALSYFGMHISQDELGQELRPYQNPEGNNDDKSVTFEEMAKKAEEYGLTAYHRPNGTIELLKLFITYDMPVITRTTTTPVEDVGHYRVVKGYDEGSRTLSQDDSLQGRSLQYSYDEFDTLWQRFNYEYVVLVPMEKKEIAETILGGEADFKTSWANAVKNAEQQLGKNPNDIYARFNLSVALYHVGEYKRSVAEFEKVESMLPFRTLWYQIEPIQAYFKLGDFQKVLGMTEGILNNSNRAFSELYLIRGETYRKMGQDGHAISEFEKAYFYNQNLISAKKALESARRNP